MIPTAAGLRLEGEDVILVESSGGATTVTKVKGSTKARRNGNRAANLAAVAAAQSADAEASVEAHMSVLTKGFVSVAFDADDWPQLPHFPLPAPLRAASLQDRFEKGSAWADVDYAAYGEVVEAVGDVVGDGEVVDADVVADTAVTIPDTVASEALRVLHEVIVQGDRKISKSEFLIAARAGMVNLLLDADGVVRDTVKDYLDRFGIIAGARNGAFRTYMGSAATGTARFLDWSTTLALRALASVMAWLARGVSLFRLVPASSSCCSMVMATATSLVTSSAMDAMSLTHLAGQVVVDSWICSLSSTWTVTASSRGSSGTLLSICMTQITTASFLRRSSAPLRALTSMTEAHRALAALITVCMPLCHGLCA